MRTILLMLVGMILPLLAATVLTAVPDRTEVGVGDTVQVTIQLADAPATTSWGALLRFNPAVLRFDGQAAGTFTTFVADSRGESAINASGEVRLGGFNMTPTTAGADGVLAVLDFTVIGAVPATRLDLIERTILEPFGSVFNHPSNDPVVPDLVDATLTNPTAAAITRTIRLQADRGGIDIPISASILPADDVGTEHSGYFRFENLDQAQNYLMSLVRRVVNNS